MTAKTLSVSIDSRLVPLCVSVAGIEANSAAHARDMLAEMLSGRRVSPSSLECEFSTESGEANGKVTLELQWDTVKVDIKHGGNTSAALAKKLAAYGATHNPDIQDLLTQITQDDFKKLDERLAEVGASLDSLRMGAVKITPAVAQVLGDVHITSINRVIHEELTGLYTLPISDKSVRLTLGRMLLAQFPLPAKRTHRFVLCQALTNLAEPEFGENLAAFALDKQHASLCGRLCEALAKSGHPSAAKHVAAVLQDCDDETKLYAIEALGELKASQYADQVRVYLNYQSSDREWTRAIKKAAENALKRM